MTSQPDTPTVNPQPEFVVHPWRKCVDYFQAATPLHVFWKPIFGDNGSRAKITYDKKFFQFHLRNHSVVFARTAAGVKEAVRRLRPQERERLDALDVEIAQHEAELKRLRLERKALVKEAFQNGHVVTLAEVEKMVEAEDARREEARLEHQRQQAERGY